ncbi:MAG: FAD-binding oxidoreductase [Chloroflexi bacterium]|nr:MAG: FAD-binding oxidoreductase [Chloroflexota bacterium]
MAALKTIPLWTDQFPRPADLPVATAVPDVVDVAIVGSGYTGLNAARVLVQNGATVAVLERETIGWGASSRNGGMATPGIKQSIQVIFRQYGRSLGRQFWQASLEAIDLIDQIVREEQLDCDWFRPGHVALAVKPTHFEQMRHKAAWMARELGHKTKLLTPSDLKGEIGSDLFYGGLADDYSGGIHPAKYVFGLARAVAQQGAYLCEHTAVSRITKLPTGYQLHTSQGILTAKEVIVATNGYTDRLLPQLKPRIFPVGSYIIVTEPLPPDLQQELSPKKRMFYDSKWFINYFRLTPDGRMLWGGRNNLSTTLDLRESAHILRRQLVHTFPQLANVAITHSWTGKLGITFDLMPHIGRIDGIHYALGYGGHGVSIATYVGTEIGLILAGKKSSSPFAEIPHPTRFFYRNRPWFIPLAAMYYRFLDKVT